MINSSIYILGLPQSILRIIILLNLGKRHFGMSMQNLEKDNYYIENNEKIIKRLDIWVEKYLHHFLELSNQISEKEEILSRIHEEFESLLPEIPFIGKNYFTDIVINSAFILAIYRSLDSSKFSDEQFGKKLFQIEEEILENYNPIRKYILKTMFLGRLGRIYLGRMAKKSKSSVFEDDTIFDLIGGDGRNLISGFDFHKCTVNEFYKKQGMSNLMPYFCLTDYAIADSFGVRLERTKSLSTGHNCCNHRYYKSNQLTKGWNIDRFDEYKDWISLKTK